MKERIQQIIKAESLTNLQFAQLLDISPAAVTHLLAGRNNPSLDIVVRIARKLPHYNLRWLLLGEGATYNHTASVAQNGNRQRDLFVTHEPVIRNQSPAPAEALPDAPHLQPEHTDANTNTNTNTNTTAAPVSPEQQKLIVCLPDGTYREYTKQH